MTDTGEARDDGTVELDAVLPEADKGMPGAINGRPGLDRGLAAIPGDLNGNTPHHPAVKMDPGPVLLMTVARTARAAVTLPPGSRIRGRLARPGGS